MAKHMTDRDIGLRAAACVRERGPIGKELRRLGLERKVIHPWESGNSPSVYSLQAMAFGGYDVHYILTGIRKIPKNPAIDDHPERP